MNRISKYIYIIRNDSLYRNSIYLMSSTAVMTIIGFFFWIISARFYTSEQVGIGTTLISIITLVSGFSFLGLGTGLIRYLPTSNRKDKKINTAFTLVMIMSLVVSLIYLTFMKTFSPKLLFVKENVFFAILFVVFALFTSLNNLSESVFVAYRSSKFILIKNTAFSITKLILPIFLIALGGYGIFLSQGIAIIIAFAISTTILILVFKYKPKLIIDFDVVKKMTRLSLGNYFAGLIVIAPTTIIPILITNILGAKFSAYFYMDMMIANVLYIIPTSTTTSLFAEGSYNEKELRMHLKKAIKIISIIIIPAILITFFFGDFFLLVFGREYSTEGFVLLRYLAASGIFITINAIGVTIINIKHKIGLLILICFINAAIILSISIILLRTNYFGVVGVGIGWLTGQGITSLIYLGLFKKLLKSQFKS